MNKVVNTGGFETKFVTLTDPETAHSFQVDVLEQERRTFRTAEVFAAAVTMLSGRRRFERYGSIRGTTCDQSDVEDGKTAVCPIHPEGRLEPWVTASVDRLRNGPSGTVTLSTAPPLRRTNGLPEPGKG